MIEQTRLGEKRAELTKRTLERTRRFRVVRENLELTGFRFRAARRCELIIYHLIARLLTNTRFCSFCCCCWIFGFV